MLKMWRSALSCTTENVLFRKNDDEEFISSFRASSALVITVQLSIQCLIPGYNILTVSYYKIIIV